METMEKPLTELVAILKHAQFNDGGLDIKLSSPDHEFVTVAVSLNQSALKAIEGLAAEVAGVSCALSEIAEAIRGMKKP
jgi:hypothetical protein